MQSDEKTDDLPTLLHEEYAAPPLDEPFSAALVGRLQAEVTPSPARKRRAPVAVGVGLAAIAAAVVAIVWMSNPDTPGTKLEVAQRTGSDADPASRSLAKSERQEQDHAHSERVDPMSRLDSTSIDSKPPIKQESLLPEAQRTESLSVVEMLRDDPANALREALSTLSRSGERFSESEFARGQRAGWPDLSAMAVQGNVLYLVDGKQLYQVSPSDGSRRRIGEDLWPHTTAMGTLNGDLYIVCDGQLYRVDPATGARRALGKPDWADARALVSVDAVLYITSGGLLYRVDPRDGSHQVLRGDLDRSKNTLEPQR